MDFNFKIFGPYPGLIYGHSERADGGMSKVKDFLNDTEGYKNRSRFLAKHEIDIGQAKVAGLVHSANVSVVGKNTASQIIADTDGLITDEKGLYLTVTVADCFPVYLYDPEKQAVGLIHAGWRGTVAGIAANVVGRMRDRFSSDPEDIKVGIGPGIRACHFEVKDDVLSNFVPFKEQVTRNNGRCFVDLQGILKSQLLKSGLKSDNIETSDECTYCQKDKYFSFRRDKGLSPMLAVIGLK